MRSLRLTRYTQDPGCCAVATSASLANYHNPTVDYELTKKIARKYVSRNLGKGLWTGQIGKLLNCLGFRRVTAISADLDFFDFSWSRLSKRNLIKKLKQSRKINKSNAKPLQEMVAFLQSEYQNRIIIDNNFKKYIKDYLDYGYPVALAFNWTLFFKYAKYDDDSKPDAFEGDHECHLVCASGYTKTGLYIVDSHHNYYKYRLAKYRKGKYHVRWEDLFNSMGIYGEVFLPENYDPSALTT